MGSIIHNEGAAWDKYKKGDDNMFAAIYNAYSGKLYKYGLRFTSNHSVIEDSIHDLFYELYKNRKTVGQTDNIFRYLMTCFRRKLFRHLNREKRYDLNNPIEDYKFEVRFSIENEIVNDENSDHKTRIFDKALLNISPRQKEAIYLKFTNELKYEEVAEIMDMSLESCRNLVYRAIKAMKEAINGNSDLS